MDPKAVKRGVVPHLLQYAMFSAVNLTCLVTGFYGSAPKDCLAHSESAQSSKISRLLSVGSNLRSSYWSEGCQQYARIYWLWAISGYLTVLASYLLVSTTIELLFVFKYRIRSCTWPMNYQTQAPRETTAKNLPVIFEALVFGLTLLFIIYAGVAQYLQLPLTLKIDRFICYMILFPPVTEVWNYYVHRLMHTRLLYRYCHSYHHRHHRTDSWSTMHHHPWDIATGHYMSHVVMLLLVRPDIYTSTIFIFVGGLSNTRDHSGLELTDNSWFHAYHHSRVMKNFGAFGWLDRLHGTFLDRSCETKSK